MDRNDRVTVSLLSVVIAIGALIIGFGALFVASDHMAFAVMDVLRHELGLRVPQDVGLVGFDNVPQAAWPSYALTTFEQPLGPMVEATADLLQRHLQEEGRTRCENVVVPGQLVLRQTTRPRAPPAR